MTGWLPWNVRNKNRSCLCVLTVVKAMASLGCSLFNLPFGCWSTVRRSIRGARLRRMLEWPRRTRRNLVIIGFFFVKCEWRALGPADKEPVRYLQSGMESLGLYSGSSCSFLFLSRCTLRHLGSRPPCGETQIEFLALASTGLGFCGVWGVDHGVKGLCLSPFQINYVKQKYGIFVFWNIICHWKAVKFWIKHNAFFSEFIIKISKNT